MFGISCRDAAPLLEMGKSIFHQMPQLVQRLIIEALFFTVFPRRDHRNDECVPGLLYERIRVIAAICQQILRINPFNQLACMSTIRFGTACNKHSDRHTMRIHGQMYLGVSPPFVSPMP